MSRQTGCVRHRRGFGKGVDAEVGKRLFAVLTGYMVNSHITVIQLDGELPEDDADRTPKG